MVYAYEGTPSERWYGANSPWNSSKVPENPGKIMVISTAHKEWALDHRTGGHH